MKRLYQAYAAAITITIRNTMKKFTDPVITIGYDSGINQPFRTTSSRIGGRNKS
jgi:hypothetical protein